MRRQGPCQTLGTRGCTGLVLPEAVWQASLGRTEGRGVVTKAVGTIRELPTSEKSPPDKGKSMKRRMKFELQDPSCFNCDVFLRRTRGFLKDEGIDGERDGRNDPMRSLRNRRMSFGSQLHPLHVSQKKN